MVFLLTLKVQFSTNLFTSCRKLWVKLALLGVTSATTVPLESIYILIEIEPDDACTAECLRYS